MTERMAEQDDPFSNPDERSTRTAREPIPVLPSEWQRHEDPGEASAPPRNSEAPGLEALAQGERGHVESDTESATAASNAHD